MKLHYRTMLGPLLSLATIAAGCGTSTGNSPNDNSTEVRSDKVRVTAPDVPIADAQQLTADNRAFALDLYRVLGTSQPGNIVVSPASVSIALAMLYGGTAGATASEIAQALHFGLPAARLHPAFDALDLALNAPPASGAGAFQLKLANAVWGQSGYAFLPGYLDLLAESYGAGLRVVDFSAAPEPARLSINAWVANQTAQKIPNLLAPGTIDPSTRLVLTNAVYFLGHWETPFSGNSPQAPFHAPGGDVMVKMMSGPKSITQWTGSGYSAAVLPYVGAAASMILVVPDAGAFATFEQGLTGDALAAVLAGQAGAPSGAVTMPGFDFKLATSLKAALGALGMQQAFDASVADLSGIDGTRSLYVSDVVHQATIAVDEKGTEAAAATGVVVGTTSAPLHELVVDRPFLFFIRHDATGAILFEGRVLNPAL